MSSDKIIMMWIYGTMKRIDICAVIKGKYLNSDSMVSNHIDNL